MVLTQRGFRVMRDTIAPDADPNAVLVLHNARMEQGIVTQRPGWDRLDTTTLGTAGTPMNGCAYEWVKLDGTSVSIIVQNGQVYSVSSSVVPTLVLSSAQLSASSITLADKPVFCVPYNNQLVFSDGTNTPFMWDGTSGGGLTKLTNAPVAFGSPTVLAAKLFFIKNSDRGTIVWSEENAANTGYEAGGYNNAWTLSQTNSEPLCAIIGTNDGLYYWRSKSIGLIRGAVTTDFTTTATHDAVANGIGHTERVTSANNTLCRAQPIHHGGYLWWYDQGLKIWRMPLGGAPEPVWQQVERRMVLGDHTGDNATVYNVNESGQWARARGIVADTTRNHVYVTYDLSGTFVFVFDGLTGALLGTENWEQITVFAFSSLGTSSPSNATLFGNALNVAAIRGGRGYTNPPLTGTDKYGTASSVAYTTTVVGPAQGYDEGTEYRFDEIDVVYETNDTASCTVVVDYLTDQAHYSTLMAASQSASATDASYQMKEQNARFGIFGHGRWIRVRVQLSGGERIGLKGWRVLAYPQSAYPLAVS